MSLAAVLAAVLAAAEPAAAPPAAPSTALAAPAPTPEAAPPAEAWKPADPANTLVIDTTKGRVIVELRPEIAPLAVARIKALAKRGYYDNSLWYRVLKGFMAQGGDKGDKQYRSDLPNLKGEFTFRKTAAMPFGSIGSTPGGEVGFVGALPVMIETPPAGQEAAPPRAWVYFCAGVSSMPHGDNPNSANSQIFLLRGHATNLEKTFTAFGRVISGQEVVDGLNNGEPPSNPDKMTKVRTLAEIPAAQRPKVQVMDTASPGFIALALKALQAKPNTSICEIPVPVQVQ
ncbi:MAG: peptidylprolyl isomerase [Caulobacteraceae bacterium]